ncbi:hypothetical protein OUZ56_008255 [Daphnia magna]|uniref:Uncharacterized protein n=1 Tax=Daphnia magna TaxID=35525 RepID=A0ABR0ACK2_9CRUS|nr:hypothetical protein OUZ56_008255 [Daphnia magna]
MQRGFCFMATENVEEERCFGSSSFLPKMVDRPSYSPANEMGVGEKMNLILYLIVRLSSASPRKTKSKPPHPTPEIKTKKRKALKNKKRDR